MSTAHKSFREEKKEPSGALWSHASNMQGLFFSGIFYKDSAFGPH